MNRKEYKVADGRTVVFKCDENGIGKITLECMDVLMGMIPQTEIVRCKDCIHHRVDDVDKSRYCHIDGRTLEAEDFCSWGEREKS